MNTYKKWRYGRISPQGINLGECELECEMSPLQFLSALAYWNRGGWIYYPLVQEGLMDQDKCLNIRN